MIPTLIISAAILIACIVKYDRFSKYGKFAQPNPREKKAHLWLLINKITIWLWFPLLAAWVLSMILFGHVESQPVASLLFLAASVLFVAVILLHITAWVLWFMFMKEIKDLRGH